MSTLWRTTSLPSAGGRRPVHLAQVVADDILAKPVKGDRPLRGRVARRALQVAGDPGWEGDASPAGGDVPRCAAALPAVARCGRGRTGRPAGSRPGRCRTRHAATSAAGRCAGPARPRAAGAAEPGQACRRGVARWPAAPACAATGWSRGRRRMAGRPFSTRGRLDGALEGQPGPAQHVDQRADGDAPGAGPEDDYRRPARQPNRRSSSASPTSTAPTPKRVIWLSHQRFSAPGFWGPARPGGPGPPPLPLSGPGPRHPGGGSPGGPAWPGPWP